MDRVIINDSLELLVKHAKNILVVGENGILIVDVSTSKITEIRDQDVAIINKDMEVLLMPQGTVDMALGALYNRGY